MRKDVFKGVCWLMTCALVFGLFAGCARAPQPVAEIKPHVPVRSIAIIPVVEPKKISLNRRAGESAMLGLIGIAVERLDATAKAGSFEVEIEKHNLKLGTDMTDALREELTRQGYSVSVLSDVNANVSSPHRFDYSKVPAQADAILHVWIIDAGVLAMRSTQPYKPHMYMGVRLVSTQDRSDLHYRWTYYGAHAHDADDGLIPADARYAFDDFEALMSNIGRVAEGLRDGPRLVAAHLAQLFRRKAI